MNPCFHSLLLELIMLQEIYTIFIYWILLSSPLSNDPRMEYIFFFLNTLQMMKQVSLFNLGKEIPSFEYDNKCDASSSYSNCTSLILSLQTCIPLITL